MKLQRRYKGKQWHMGADCDGGFDELIIDDWFHLERMSDTTWWMRVCDDEFDIDAKKRVCKKRAAPSVHGKGR